MMQPSPTFPRRLPRSALGARMGYTAVEVMMALAVLTVGAAGIIAMQKTTLAGSLQARNLTSGVNVNAGWLDHLAVEAMVWNDSANGDINQMERLWDAGAFSGVTTAVPVGPWVFLGATSLEGDEVDPATAIPAAYCTQARVAWIGDAASSDALRVELRTFWARSGRPINAECLLDAPDWTAPIEDPSATIAVGGIERGRHEYGFALATGVIRRTD